MKLGAENKKQVIAVAILAPLALYLVYTNVIATPSPGPRATASRNITAEPSAISPPSDQPSPRRAAANRGRTDEWLPIVHPKRPEDRLKDTGGVDPSVRWDLLAKVQSVEPDGVRRNLFQFGQPPVKEVAAVKPLGPETKVFVPVGPKAPAPPAPPPPPPPPPPIPLKFYGISTLRADGKKTAYFLDGDEILHASEGETLKRRYKVLHIGPSSVLMEDTEAKHQQTVPLAEEAQS